MTRWKEGGFATFRPEYYWILAFAAFLFLPGVRAIDPPEITIIPSNLSVNSSFLIIANPNALPTEPVSLNWIFYGIEGGIGGFPPRDTNNRWVCYFSNTETDICGPSLFPSPTYGIPYTIEVNAIKYGQTLNSTKELYVGGITITPRVDVIDKTVYMSAVAASAASRMNYKIYSADTLGEVKAGYMNYNPQYLKYISSNFTLPDGNYYIEFTINAGGDFGGSVSKIAVGGGTVPVGDIRLESCTGTTCQVVSKISYSTTINSGQTFTLKKFKLTNTGTENITAIDFILPSEPVDVSRYLSISAESTILRPNESTFLSITLKNIQSDTNISTTATMSSDIMQFPIPLEFKISVIGQSVTCEGKDDLELCLGGRCCSGTCIIGAVECCSDLNCISGTCSSEYKCIQAGECEGKANLNSCGTDGICCDSSCISGGECCTSFDCTGTDEYCTADKKCESNISPPLECEGKSDSDSCTGGVCCGGSCVECCADSDCTNAGETCSSSNICEIPETPPGPDIVTISLIGGGVAAAALVGFFLFKKFRKKKDAGEEELEEGGDKEEDEFSDEDFY